MPTASRCRSAAPTIKSPMCPLGTGPYKAIMAEDPSLPDHTLYYPADMAAAGKLPIITWGNGACLNAGNRFRIALTEMASHGFLIVAGGPIANTKYEVGPQENPPVGQANAPRRAPPPQAAPKPGDAVGRNTVPQLIAGIDWAVKENDRARAANSIIALTPMRSAWRGNPAVACWRPRFRPIRASRRRCCSRACRSWTAR